MSLLSKYAHRTRESPSARRTLIGLDWGTSAIRAVQLRRSHGDRADYEIIALAEGKRSGETDPGEGGLLRPAPDMIADLRGLLRRGGFKGRALVTGLDSSELVAEALSLPLGEADLDDPQIRAALAFELGRHTGYEPEEAEIRAWRLPAGGAQAPTVMGVAARRGVLLGWIRALELAGFQCRRIDSSACALVRCCTVLGDPQYDSIWAVLDIGLLSSRLVIAARGVPVLQRDISTGGGLWSYHVAEKLGLSAEAAEQLKIDYGIALSSSCDQERSIAGPDDGAEFLARQDSGHDETSESDTSHRKVSKLVFSAIRKSLSALGVEVEKSLAYAMHIYGDLPVSALYLTGGGSGLIGLSEFLGQEIGIEAQVLDPLSAFEGGSPRGARGRGGAWAKAVGFALLG